MTDTPIRTRFAPSPTGYLHIGGARTALFCWLFAKRQNGTFILRIEDTDRERSTPESIQAILDGMEWLGLDYDEGPFYQTKRMDRYADVIAQLVDQGHAYRCYCKKERLDSLRETQMDNKQKPRYDGRCRDQKDQPGDQPFVIRFKNPQEGGVTFDDLVRGSITVENKELDDLIIARTDGTPTYNFTVVIDDADMQITHVIRGDDHINNTPRQINLFNALNIKPPKFAHLPMILGPDGKRLSKRHGAVSVLQYREDGYLPEALMNYLVRLGWSFGDQEIFSEQQMIDNFSLAAINRAAAAVNPEKLDWINQHYLKTLDPSQIAKPLIDQFKKLNTSIENGPVVEKIIELQRERCKTLVEMAKKSRYFYHDIDQYTDDAKQLLSAEVIPLLKIIQQELTQLTTWQKSSIKSVIKEIAGAQTLKLGKVFPPIRAAVTGSTVSPSVDVTLELIGKERVLERLQNAIQWIEQQQGQAHGTASTTTG
jgi:glutamyl-tRNA synthetase